MKRKFSFKFLMLIPSIAILLSSCSSAIPLDVFDYELNANKAGTDYSETIFKSKNPVAVLDILNNNEVLKVYIYKLMTYITVGQGVGKEGAARQFSFDFCAVVFENDKLFYWGSIDDFKKEQDSTIQLIGKKVKEEILQRKNWYEL